MKIANWLVGLSLLSLAGCATTSADGDASEGATPQASNGEIKEVYPEYLAEGLKSTERFKQNAMVELGCDNNGATKTLTNGAANLNLELSSTSQPFAVTDWNVVYFLRDDVAVEPKMIKFQNAVETIAPNQQAKIITSLPGYKFANKTNADAAIDGEFMVLAYYITGKVGDSEPVTLPVECMAFEMK